MWGQECHHLTHPDLLSASKPSKKNPTKCDPVSSALVGPALSTFIALLYLECGSAWAALPRCWICMRCHCEALFSCWFLWCNSCSIHFFLSYIHTYSLSALRPAWAFVQPNVRFCFGLQCLLEQSIHFFAVFIVFFYITWCIPPSPSKDEGNTIALLELKPQIMARGAYAWHFNVIVK